MFCIQILKERSRGRIITKNFPQHYTHLESVRESYLIDVKGFDDSQVRCCRFCWWVKWFFKLFHSRSDVIIKYQILIIKYYCYRSFYVWSSTRSSTWSDDMMVRTSATTTSVSSPIRARSTHWSPPTAAAATMARPNTVNVNSSFYYIFYNLYI